MLELLERCTFDTQQLRTILEPTPVGDQAERQVWGTLAYSRTVAETPLPARPYEGSNLEAYHAAQAAVQLSIIQLRLATEPALRQKTDMEIIEAGWLPTPVSPRPVMPAGATTGELGVTVDVQVAASTYKEEPPVKRPDPLTVPVIPDRPAQAGTTEAVPAAAEAVAPEPRFSWRSLGTLSLLRFIRRPRQKRAVPINS